MKTPFRWTVEIELSPVIVGDGLDLSNKDVVHDALMRAFPLVRGHEIEVRVIKKPDPAVIRREQGYGT